MPELGKIYEGEIASVQSYGAFVKVPGWQKDGMSKLFSSLP